MKLNKNTEDLVKKISSGKINIQNYINNLDEKKIEKILRDLSSYYYNEGISLVSDEIFDMLKEYLEKISPDNAFLNEIGAPIESKEKVKLPYSMGSLDKIKPDSQILDKWKKSYKGPYVISDKLDGISCQLYLTKNSLRLYTRGDGEYGQDISYLAPYLVDIENLVTNKELKYPVSVRGELIISKKNFKKLGDKFKNARNAVSGFVNAKKVDKALSEVVEFIGYNVIEPKLTQEEQMKFLKKNKITKKIVEYKIYNFDELTNERLSKYLEERRNESNYEVDGIVVYDSSRHYDHSSGNPEHGFAFKTVLADQYAEALVVDVIWDASMDGFLKPRVQINPLNLVGVTITYATAFHGKFVEENKLGPGSIIKIIRSGDVIPHIMEVIKPSTSGKPKMPDVEYIWDKNHVNILVKNMSKGEYANMIKAKKMDYFFSMINVKNISLGILTKLVDNGYDNIISILDADKKKLANIEGFGNKLIDKIFENIDESFKNLTLDKLMAASHVFGTGLAEKKIKQIIKDIPDILKISNKKELREKVINVEGFSDILADKFVDNLETFVIFYNQLKKRFDLKYLEDIISKKKEEKTKEQTFKDQKIVFTGFRDAVLQDLIESLGGKVSTSVSSKTTLVVHADNETTSSKLKDAEKNNITIISKTKFLEKYNIIV